MQNQPGSDLDGLVRFWLKASGPEASRCAGIVGPGSGRFSRFQTWLHHSSTDGDDDDDDDDDDAELRMLVDIILWTNCDQCLGMVQCCFTSTETVRLFRTESPGRPPRLSHSS